MQQIFTYFVDFMQETCWPEYISAIRFYLPIKMSQYGTLQAALGYQFDTVDYPRIFDFDGRARVIII